MPWVVCCGADMTRLPLAALCATAAVLVLGASTSSAATLAITRCPTFRVLHNNNMSGYQKGTYDMQVWGNVTCQRAVKMFQDYLQNPRDLPRGWKATPRQASFSRGSATGFSLTLTKRKQTQTPTSAVTNCPTFRVVRPDPDAGYEEGTYELQVFGDTTCKQAASVFKAYLDDPTNGLPDGWTRVRTPPSFVNGDSGFSVFLP